MLVGSLSVGCLCGLRLLLLLGSGSLLLLFAGHGKKFCGWPLLLFAGRGSFKGQREILQQARGGLSGEKQEKRNFEQVKEGLSVDPIFI